MGTGEERTKEWGTEILDLWKGEGWGGEHGVNKMDTTGTFRTLHDGELLGKKAWNLKEVGLGWINYRGFGWGKIRGGGEQLFWRPRGKTVIEECVGVYSKGGKKNRNDGVKVSSDS